MKRPDAPTGSRHPAGAATRAVHAGERQDPPRRPVSLPIHQTAPFVFDSVEELDRAFSGREEGGRDTLYSRYGNPTVRVVEEKVAALEGAEDAIAFASGMAAVTAALSTLLVSGDRLLAAEEIYGGTHGWLRWLARRHPEIGIDRAPLAELPERLEAGLPEATRAVYLETPTNPLIACCDLARAAAAARRQGALVVVDNTFATPVLQSPLALGAHVVVHSATKFLAGHSDVTAGVVAGDAETMAAVRETRIYGGGCLDPHAAFLVSRGMKTLTLRVERQSANAARLAGFLASHPQVARVYYPGYGDGFDPVAAGQMKAGGGMLAFDLAAGAGGETAAAAAFVDGLELIRIIPSLGGVETGVMVPALTSHRQLTGEERRRIGIGDGLIRLSCGIEDAGDLEADLARGLDRVGAPERG